jgi:peptide methionine sulfoxide reductase MsrB
MARAAVPLLLVAARSAGAVELATFDGAPATTFKFVELNDPVMGGRSTGTWALNATAQTGVFDGEVVDVPSLKAPGFIKAAADGSFPDASSAAGGDLVLEVRTTTPEYEGFRVSFASGTLSAAYACAGGGSIPLSRGCFKANFSVPAGDSFSAVRIPLRAFSDKWSPATGKQTVTCAQDADVCPTAAKLAKIVRLELWAEGALGRAHLEVKSIAVEQSGGVSEANSVGEARQVARVAEGVPRQHGRPPAEFGTCSGPVQPGLRYNISGRTEPDVPVPVDPDESLAEAVCCDSRTKVFAEPQFLFEAPDIAMFSRLQEGTTVFYDSVCGIPLFRAPVNRSVEDFKADTVEHGWPSFRSAEVVQKNVVTNTTTGFVYSTCGTHLGSYLPDKRGPRWCMDLSCISGNPPEQNFVFA